MPSRGTGVLSEPSSGVGSLRRLVGAVARTIESCAPLSAGIHLKGHCSEVKSEGLALLPKTQPKVPNIRPLCAIEQNMGRTQQQRHTADLDLEFK